MRCRICDAVLANPHFNRDHGDIDPCPTCLNVINDVFSDEDPPEEEGEISLTPEEAAAQAEDALYRFDVV